MAGFCIFDDDVAIEASKQEIVRRYFASLKNKLMGKYNQESVDKAAMLMNQVGVDINYRKCVAPCLEKAKENNVPYMAIELPDGEIITGKTSLLFRSPASLILNSLKD